ncbi:MAG: hypothetical protein IJD17_06885 [Clostridia bacterium]|nr:hypothetical protein [Clostridia bacterium]
MKKIISFILFLTFLLSLTSCTLKTESDAEKYPEYTIETEPNPMLEDYPPLIMESLLKRDNAVLLEFTVSDEMYRETRYRYPDEAQLEGKTGVEREGYKQMLTTEYDYYYIPLEVESQSFYSEIPEIDEIGVMAEAMIFADSVKIGSRFLTVTNYYGEDSPIVITTNPRMLYYITDENTILPVCNETLLHDECIGLTVDEFKEYLTDMREKVLAETDEVVEYYD